MPHTLCVVAIGGQVQEDAQGVGKIRARYLNDPLLELESFVDDPEGAHPLSSLHRAHVDLAIGPNHPYLVLALEVMDSPLGHEERSSLHAGGGPDLRVLARTQDIPWIRELAPGAECARRHANLAVCNDQFVPVGEAYAPQARGVHGLHRHVEYPAVADVMIETKVGSLFFVRLLRETPPPAPTPRPSYSRRSHAHARNCGLRTPAQYGASDY